MNFQGKEGVENAGVSGSTEEASLHSIPSHGPDCRGAVPLEKKAKEHQGFSKYFSVIYCVLTTVLDTLSKASILSAKIIIFSFFLKWRAYTYGRVSTLKCDAIGHWVWNCWLRVSSFWKYNATEAQKRG